ncbi:MAG TPA: 30S ribosomal protein S20 [Acidobacteriota bacterium]|jgi:small subunit ribosomal protein S20
MPIIKSAKKRMRQDIRRRADNRQRRSTLRTAIRRLREAIEAGDTAAVKTRWSETQGLLDRTARLGIIHPNAAARTKSRLARRIQKLS